jgi:hypothetical protein
MDPLLVLRPVAKFDRPTRRIAIPCLRTLVIILFIFSRYPILTKTDSVAILFIFFSISYLQIVSP